MKYKVRQGLASNLHAVAARCKEETWDHLAAICNLAASRIEAGADLLAALEAYDRAVDSLFRWAGDRGIADAWGNGFDCTKLKQAQQKATTAIAKAKGEQ